MQQQNLWRNAAFNNLWIAQSISLVGSQVTALALPLTAALLLGATPLQMGFLGAAAFVPFMIFGLFAGVWADRWPRRPVLIAADLGRALLLGFIPLAAFFGVLRIEQLYVIQLLAGVLTVFFDVANEAYLPSLVARDQLVDGNSKLEISRSFAFVSGPSLAGALVQLLTAPVTILIDILSFLLSACFLLRIRIPEQPRAARPRDGNIWRQIGEGLMLLLGNRYLRAIVIRTSAVNLCDRVMQAVYVLYLTRELMIGPALLGLLFGMTGIGALVGAVGARWAARYIRVGHAIVGASVLGGIGSLLYPLAGSWPALTLPILAAGHVFLGMSHPIYNINQISLRQAITPDHLRGRLIASARFLAWGTIPIGWLIGGALGEIIGLRPTLFVGAAGVMLAALVILLSPVTTLRVVSDAIPIDPLPAPSPSVSLSPGA